MTRDFYDDNTTLWSPALNSLLNASNHELVKTGCDPSKGTGDWDIDITSGAVLAGLNAGSVHVSAQTVTLTAPSNDTDMGSGEGRIDLVTVNSSGTASGTEGTAASNPTAPAIPSGEVLVAFIHVENSDSTVADSDIFDPRVLQQVPSPGFVGWTGWDHFPNYGHVSSTDVSTNSSPLDIAFNNDGTKMFLVGTTNDDVVEYSLSTAWDPTSASHTSSTDISTQTSVPDGLAFSFDGEEMFVVSSVGTIDEYSLSTRFDVSTESHNSETDISTRDNNLSAITFNPAGDKMFILGEQNFNVYEYSLSTAFDVSTNSFTQSFDVSSQLGAPAGLAFDDTGRRLYVGDHDSTTPEIYQYRFRQAYDVGDGYYTGTLFDTSNGGTSDPQGHAFDPGAARLFVCNAGGQTVETYHI